MKIDLASVPPRASALAGGLSPGIFPYLGASVRLDELRSVVAAYGGAVVTGKRGARLAADVPGVLIDPAGGRLVPCARRGVARPSAPRH